MGRLMSVTCVRRQGMRVGFHRHADHDRGVGALLVEERTDQEMKRAVRTARLVNPDKKPADQLAPLHDVTLLWLKEDLMVLSGIERIGGMGGMGGAREYAQTWLCEWLSDTEIDIHKVRGAWPPGVR